MVIISHALESDQNTIQSRFPSNLGAFVSLF
jgi:hypothetical protein